MTVAGGIAPRTAAVIPAGSLVPTALVGRPSPPVLEGEARAAEEIQFAKNLTMPGGLLLATADEE